MVRNVHERTIHARPEEVGSLIDRLASRDDALWPCDRWPAMRFDRPLAVGASGGHGLVRYTVAGYEPGRSILFRFTGPRGFLGTHGFDVLESAPGTGVLLRHTLSVRLHGLAHLTWPLAIRWLHDALIEDALDCAEAYAGKSMVQSREWTVWVKFLRWLLRPFARHARGRGSRRAVEKGS